MWVPWRGAVGSNIRFKKTDPLARVRVHECVCGVCAHDNAGVEAQTARVRARARACAACECMNRGWKFRRRVWARVHVIVCAGKVCARARERVQRARAAREATGVVLK